MKRFLLDLLKVPEHPQPPPGDDAALITFRASRRHLTYRLILWVPGQISALIGIVVSLVFLGWIEGPSSLAGAEIAVETMDRVVGRISERILRTDTFSPDAAMIFNAIEALAIFFFLVQLLSSAWLIKLSWELTWYMVGDQSLRIREGLWKLREQTMTLANIQNMMVRQNPLQRLLGIADLEIHTAGGGSGKEDSGKESHLHIGRLRGLDDAEALRDRLRARLVQVRGAGLGDHEDHDDHEDSDHLEARIDHADPRLDAARALLHEARALRAALAPDQPTR